MELSARHLSPRYGLSENGNLADRDHLTQLPCDTALLTWALTWALTLKLALNGPVASDAPTAVTHLAQISQTSTQEAKPDGLAQPRRLSG
jgi:hypothetical protein